MDAECLEDQRGPSREKASAADVGKEDIRHHARRLGADAVGFAAVKDYRSPRSPDPASILPGVRSMVVLGYRETHGAVESENPRIGMGSRMGGMELSLKRLLGANPEARPEILKDPVLLHLYQAQMIGFQYTCFRCPAGRASKNKANL